MTSQLSPWEDEEAILRKRSSLKRTGRQSKNSRSNLKETKKRNKKECEKINDAKTKLNNTGKCKKDKFAHYADIKQYIKDYREARCSQFKEEKNSAINIYGQEEIAKTYERLGISTKSLGKTESPDVDEDGRESTVSETDERFCDVAFDNVMSSPEVRERRNNLNLSPLRKQMRLPDMNNYPVQTVSGNTLLELARITTTRNKLETNKPLPSISEKKNSTTPLELQEKVLCRVVDLALPPSRGIKSNKQHIFLSNDCKDVFKMKHISATDHCLSAQNFVENCSADKKLIESNISNSTDDALIVALKNSRSCQSSTISNKMDSLSPLSTVIPNKSPTVKDLLTAAVTDMSNYNYFEKINKNKFKCLEQTEKSRNSKFIVSPQVFRNLYQKSSMKNVEKEILTAVSEKQLDKGKEETMTESRSIQKPINAERLSTLPDLIVHNSFNKTINTSEISSYTPKTEAAKLRKKARQRQEAAEKYEQFKRALALDTKPKKMSKLAILSKCNTVVKPRVALKGAVA